MFLRRNVWRPFKKNNIFLPIKKVKVYVIQHARALDIRYVPASSWDADYSFYDW